MRSVATYLSNPTTFDWPLIATQQSCYRLSPKQSGWSMLVDVTLLLLKRLFFVFFLRHTSPIWPAKFVPMQQNGKSVRREGAETLRGPLTAADTVWVSIQVCSGNQGPKMAPDGCNTAWTIMHKWFYNFKHYISFCQSTGSWLMYTIIKELSILWTWSKKNVFLSWWRCYPLTQWSRYRRSTVYTGSAKERPWCLISILISHWTRWWSRLFTQG